MNQSALTPDPYEDVVLRKISWRLIPFMFLLYIVSYLDRINVGFAALQMNQDLGFSATVYGTGAGIFFIGYFLFEVPSNLIMERVGARRWMARILITWGLISSAMMFVGGKTSFYVLRFLLGLAEAGFFPGMILYLTYWFPAESRARAVARFTTATAIAGVIGGPVSGLLLEMHGMAGLRGWQWLFLIEGLPAVVLGVITLFYLDDGPDTASWLSGEEKSWLKKRLEDEVQEKEKRHGYTLRQALVHGKVWLLAVAYFSLVMSFYGVSFWMPQIIKAFSGLDNLAVGILSAIPYVGAAAGMLVIAASSDRRRERRWHAAGSALVGAAGLALSASAGRPVIGFVWICVGAMGIWGALGPFWSLPTAILSGRAAAGGIALINSVGNLGGFAGPYLLGLVKDATQDLRSGILVLVPSLMICALLLLASESRPQRRGEH